MFALMFVGLIVAIGIAVWSGARIQPGPEKVFHSYLLAGFVGLVFVVGLVRSLPFLLEGPEHWTRTLGVIGCLLLLATVGSHLVIQGRHGKAQ
jgi:hypothetical protein